MTGINRAGSANVNRNSTVRTLKRQNRLFPRLTLLSARAETAISVCEFPRGFTASMLDAPCQRRLQGAGQWESLVSGLPTAARSCVRGAAREAVDKP